MRLVGVAFGFGRRTVPHQFLPAPLPHAELCHSRGKRVAERVEIRRLAVFVKIGNPSRLQVTPERAHGRNFLRQDETRRTCSGSHAFHEFSQQFGMQGIDFCLRFLAIARLRRPRAPLRCSGPAGDRLARGLGLAFLACLPSRLSPTNHGTDDPSRVQTKWVKVSAKESAAYQSHFDDLCRLLKIPPPLEADPTGVTFYFQKHVVKDAELGSCGVNGNRPRAGCIGQPRNEPPPLAAFTREQVHRGTAEFYLPSACRLDAAADTPNESVRFGFFNSTATRSPHGMFPFFRTPHQRPQAHSFNPSHSLPMYFET